MRFNRIVVALAVSLVSSVGVAADPDQAIRTTLKAIDPSMPIEAIAESPMTGL